MILWDIPLYLYGILDKIIIIGRHWEYNRFFFKWDWTYLEDSIHEIPEGMVKLPSGELTVCYGKSQFLMGKLTINGHFQ